MFRVFVRTWYVRDDSAPLERRPGAGKKHYIGTAETEEEAREMCRAYNDSRDPGWLSRKAEYESAD